MVLLTAGEFLCDINFGGRNTSARTKLLFYKAKSNATPEGYNKKSALHASTKKSVSC